MVKINLENTYVQIIFWIVIIVVALYLYLVVEPRHNSCWENRAKECGPDKFKIDPEEGDTDADLLKRVEAHTQLDQEKVFWRRSLLFGLIISIVLLTLYHKKVPPIGQVFIATLIIFIALYFHNSYYTMHFDMRSHNYAKITVDELRYRWGIAERPSVEKWTEMW